MIFIGMYTLLFFIDDYKHYNILYNNLAYTLEYKIETQNCISEHNIII